MGHLNLSKEKAITKKDLQTENKVQLNMVKLDRLHLLLNLSSFLNAPMEGLHAGSDGQKIIKLFTGLHVIPSNQKSVTNAINKMY